MDEIERTIRTRLDRHPDNAWVASDIRYLLSLLDAARQRQEALPNWHERLSWLYDRLKLLEKCHNDLDNHAVFEGFRDLFGKITPWMKDEQFRPKANERQEAEARVVQAAQKVSRAHRRLVQGIMDTDLLGPLTELDAAVDALPKRRLPTVADLVGLDPDFTG